MVSNKKGNKPNVDKRKLGRPKNTKASIDIAVELINATSLLLRDFDYQDLTEVRIAEQVGVDKKMIHYYFGDKDNLLFEVFKQRYEETMAALALLNKIDPNSKDVTRQIISLLVNAVYSKPWIEKTISSEISQKKSTTHKLWFKKYGIKSMEPSPLLNFVETLMKLGVYDKTIGAEMATRSIMFMVTAPFIHTNLFTTSVDGLEQYKSQEWIDYVAELFDRQLRRHKLGK